MSDNPPWRPGQQAVINRETVVTIERVTPVGRAIINGLTFNADGTGRSGGSRYLRARLEPLTPEIQAEMDFAVRGKNARAEADVAIDRAQQWLWQTFGLWGRGSVPEPSDVELAEEIAAALQRLMVRSNV